MAATICSPVTSGGPCRALTQGRAAEILLGHPASYWVSRSLLWCVVLVGVFGPLAVARYRKG